jgi:hypothetical protein
MPALPVGKDVCYTNSAEPDQDHKDATHSGVIMRALFAVLALLGVAGIGFGVLTMISGARAGVPFGFEDYGGPGSLIGGLLLAAVSLYLLFNWGRLESSQTAHRD